MLTKEFTKSFQYILNRMTGHEPDYKLFVQGYYKPSGKYFCFAINDEVSDDQAAEALPGFMQKATESVLRQMQGDQKQ